MERIQALISKLQEQVDRGADPGQMMFTLQLLQSEVQQMQSQRSRNLGTSKVAVVLPSFSSGTAVAADVVKEGNGTPVEKITQPASSKYAPQPAANKQMDFHFDPLTEIPTLSHQKTGKDLNESIAEAKESLNDRLKAGKTELSEKLTGSPIRDLRKAIGVNDRFLFIHELFRGDESMYERSLKTINSFNIYAEAEYWISRELKVKLGWEDDNETALYFYQLVKRRFS